MNDGHVVVQCTTVSLGETLQLPVYPEGQRLVVFVSTACSLLLVAAAFRCGKCLPPEGHRRRAGRLPGATMLVVVWA